MWRRTQDAETPRSVAVSATDRNGPILQGRWRVSLLIWLGLGRSSRKRRNHENEILCYYANRRCLARF